MTMWIILTGLMLTPTEYASLARLLPGRVRTLDSWNVPITAPIEDIRVALGVTSEPVVFIGHSVGGLAAIDWALRYPEQVDRVVLLDPTTTVFAPPSKLSRIAGGFADVFLRRLVKCDAVPIGVVAPTVRRIIMRLLTGKVDPLAKTERVARYGNALVLRQLIDQYFDVRTRQLQVGAYAQGAGIGSRL